MKKDDIIGNVKILSIDKKNQMYIGVCLTCGLEFARPLREIKYKCTHLGKELIVLDGEGNIVETTWWMNNSEMELNRSKGNKVMTIYEYEREKYEV